MEEDLAEWYYQRLVVSSSKSKKHIRAMVVKGLYEGETLLFPFIASGNLDAVRWLLRFPEETTNAQKPGGSG